MGKTSPYFMSISESPEEPYLLPGTRLGNNILNTLRQTYILKCDRQTKGQQKSGPHVSVCVCSPHKSKQCLITAEQGGYNSFQCFLPFLTNAKNCLIIVSTTAEKGAYAVFARIFKIAVVGPLVNVNKNTKASLTNLGGQND